MQNRTPGEKEMNRIVTMFLLLVSVLALSDCRQNKVSVKSRLTLLGKVSDSTLKKASAAVGPRRPSSGFREDDISEANASTLAFLCGVNFSQIAWGLRLGENDRVVDGIDGLKEIERIGARRGLALKRIKEMNETLVKHGDPYTMYQEFRGNASDFAADQEGLGKSDFAKILIFGLDLFEVAVRGLGGDAQTSSLADALWLEDLRDRIQPVEARDKLVRAVDVLKTASSDAEKRRGGRLLMDAIKSLSIEDLPEEKPE